MTEFQGYIKQAGNYAYAALAALQQPRKSLSDFAETVSGASAQVMDAASTAATRMLDNVHYLMHRACQTVTAIRSTAHGAVDGAMIGMVGGFFIAGPFGMGWGAWIGTAAGAVYGFSNATENPYATKAFTIL
ncbi:MAG: hypothetical protein KDK64_05755 [Chlamydiia bacterium]|nr:hypothetical protein [Chlamydiia bacterium]